MDDCIFCKIVRKEIPADIIYENADTMVFLEIKPSSLGHSMVISKKHGFSILDYDEKELGLLMSSVKIVAQALERAFSCGSISIGINHKEIEGVPHLHIHLIPRFKDDDGGIMQTIVNRPPKETLKEVAEKIRQEL